MLAPMQGLTNHELRALFVDWVRPDVVFTEFVRVNAAAPRRRISRSDLRELRAEEQGVPLVTQLIGHGRDALVAAAQEAQAAGAVHLNLNLGCPYGRMTSGLTGGSMLRRPADLVEILPPLRQAVQGSFSVKLRAGYDDPDQVFTLLPLFEEAGVDFLILHPRTVVQEYRGVADHRVTAAVVRRTWLPVIANGDVRTAAEGVRLLNESGAAGLMLGRGAIADPFLFLRLRGEAPAAPDRATRQRELGRYLHEVVRRYGRLFCGDTQVLNKTKAILCTMADPDLEKLCKSLKKARTLAAFSAILDDLP
jgi:tRNA-dihydrouridine synthase